ncbi:MAG: hypothetical protein IPK65_06570 [Gammaproteobacteria bacterium]|nr:hypothetical protein [Gammaproteobacteria bacterium]
MVTAENTAQVVMGVLECHPDDYLSLPFTREQFSARMQRLLRRREETGAIEVALEEQRYEEALSLCDKRMTADCAEVLELLRLKAEAFVALEKFPQAEAIYAQVFTRRKAVWAGLGSGRVRFLQKDYTGAAVAFERTLVAHPRQLEAYDWLARVRTLLGDHDAARKSLGTASNFRHARYAGRWRSASSLRDGHYRLAARAFGAAVALGSRSVYRTASSYIKQARALMQF